VDQGRGRRFSRGPKETKACWEGGRSCILSNGGSQTLPSFGFRPTEATDALNRRTRRTATNVTQGTKLDPSGYQESLRPA